MPDLHFRVEGVVATQHAASPQVTFRLHIRNATAEPIHAVALRCQIRLEPAWRSYTPEEQAELHDLFGEPSRWGQTVRSLLWTNVAVMVPSFSGETSVEFPVPCTFDFTVGVTKYFHGLHVGDVPVLLLFSGTIFHEEADGSLRVALVSWEREASCRLAVSTWKELMDHYYPNSTWLRLNRGVFERLGRYRSNHGLLTWEQAIERLLDSRDPS
jgi:Family of unknown function (DUF6084)